MGNYYSSSNMPLLVVAAHYRDCVKTQCLILPKFQLGDNSSPRCQRTVSTVFKSLAQKSKAFARPSKTVETVH